MKAYVLIIDFGSQFTQIIARKIRKREVSACVVSYYDVLSYDLSSVSAIILSGGDQSLEISDCLRNFMRDIIELDVPLLCICYGHQLLCEYFGGEIKKNYNSEFGQSKINIEYRDSIVDSIADSSIVWTSHNDSVYSIPDVFKVIASNNNNQGCEIVKHKDKAIYGIQFHPEVSHTSCGDQILLNFLNISGVPRDWKVGSFLESARSEILKCGSGKKIIAAVSGGVDSTVASKLLVDTLGPDNIKCVFIDTGLGRKGEVERVRKAFDSLNIPLEIFDESDRFFNSLRGIEEPELKRKLIGKEFIESFQRNCLVFDADCLMQGTLYSDVIESGKTSSGANIKSHHNVGGIPENMSLSLIEPLRTLFKDEVRLLGTEIGIDSELLNRHPFPGPGLAVRVLGPVDRKSVEILREADDIYINLLRSNGLYDKIWQAFTVLLPVKSVGVMGDKRTYGHVCALRAISSEDGMTAEVFPYSDDACSKDFWYVLKISASRIINSVEGINRVVYDITSKPPGTIEWS